MPPRPTQFRSLVAYASDGLPGIPGSGPSGIPGGAPSGIPGASSFPQAPTGPPINLDKPATQHGTTPGGRPIFELAGWGARLGAALLDMLIVWAVLAAAVGAVSFASLAGDTAALVVGVVIAIPTILLAICLVPWTMARNQGSSYGKLAVGIRVVRADGTDVDFGFAFLREFVIKQLAIGALGAVTVYLATVLNYLWPLWDDENRALHDMMAKSRVVRR